MTSEPPLMDPPRPPTEAEIARANEAVAEMWPSLLMLIRHQNGVLTVKFQDGTIAHWDAAGVTRHKPKRADIDISAA